MSEINISRKDLNNINDSPIVRMEGVKGAAELFGLPKHLVRTLALTGKVKAVRVGNGKILINIQSLNDYFNTSVISTEERDCNSGGIQPIPVK